LVWSVADETDGENLRKMRPIYIRLRVGVDLI
jgi:hypothetical protein